MRIRCSPAGGSFDVGLAATRSGWCGTSKARHWCTPQTHPPDSQVSPCLVLGNCMVGYSATAVWRRFRTSTRGIRLHFRQSCPGSAWIDGESGAVRVRPKGGQGYTLSGQMSCHRVPRTVPHAARISDGENAMERHGSARHGGTPERPVRERRVSSEERRAGSVARRPPDASATRVARCVSDAGRPTSLQSWHAPRPNGHAPPPRFANRSRAPCGPSG